MAAESHEIILHKRSLTPFEKHRRSKDVLQILSPSSAVLQSPMLDGEYEFNFDQIIDDDELPAVLKHQACNKFLTALIGGGKSCFVQYGLVNQNNDEHITTLLDHLTSELFAYIQSSSKCIEFTLQNSFVAVNKNSNIDLLSANYIHGGFDASKVYVFDPEQLSAAFQRGVGIYHELLQHRPIHKFSTLAFSVFLAQRNTNTNHIRYSRFDYVILPGDANHLSNIVNSLKQPKYECACNSHRQVDDSEQSLRSCYKCHFKSLLSLSRVTAFTLSVSPSNLEARSTLRVIQFGQFLSGHSKRMDHPFNKESITQEDEFNLVQTVKHMENLLLNENGTKKLKMNEKLKLRKMIEESVMAFEDSDKDTVLESQSREISTLKNTVSAQHEKILELEAELESRRKSDNTGLNGRQTVLETSLKLSLFRERQAVYFLRQFRRFYRRVLKHKAMQGDTNMHTLDSLEGIDSTLLKLGIIFENDVAYDDAPILQSDEDCHEVSKLAAEEAFTKFTMEAIHNQGHIDVQIKDNLADVKLLNELSVMSETCTKLQVEIDFLKNMEILEKAPTDLVRKECLTLKTQLEKSKEELNAVVYKLNELNTNNLLLSNQVDQIKRLEDLVVELQHNMRELNKDKDATEKTLTDRVILQEAKLNALMTPLLHPSYAHTLFDKDEISGNNFYFPIVGGELGRNESEYENRFDSKSNDTESESTSYNACGNSVLESNQIEDGETVQAHIPNRPPERLTTTDDSAEEEVNDDIDKSLSESSQMNDGETVQARIPNGPPERYVTADNTAASEAKDDVNHTSSDSNQMNDGEKVQTHVPNRPLERLATADVAVEGEAIDDIEKTIILHAKDGDEKVAEFVETSSKFQSSTTSVQENATLDNDLQSPATKEDGLIGCLSIQSQSISNDQISVPLVYSTSTVEIVNVGTCSFGQCDEIIAPTKKGAELSRKQSVDNASIVNYDSRVSPLEEDNPLVAKDLTIGERIKDDSDQEINNIRLPLNEVGGPHNEALSPPQATGTISHEPIITVTSAVSKLDGAQIRHPDTRQMLDKSDAESLSTLTAENSRANRISMFAGGRNASEKPRTYSRKLGPSIRSGVVNGKSKRRNKRIVRSST
mmetsp:Transcript_27818/g.43171  ORF Transcript_27818/g.43171 Transcript_27818/m.43171 type:complete len:1112 (+) Transcript_27818:151-3486(+)|eukprot:CAMPEP_0196822766 /NCGR_PEP_ID=MMETSP1362-20130617/84722_1 /TAXON_ID=163516 /ORGANISM="Leptocylindrus danicus, Strain CCMP1856" /LENGTH=1111 /DNA_ID=CAMNT_0042202417 /DNA_START=51 /DNA_END=3386 /DNA_ORIENTATION=+